MEINDLKKEIDSWLEDYFYERKTYNKRLYEAMHYSISAGGKRVRPLLMILSYLMYKDDYKKILPLACAVEMIHTYSLIHDDLPCMDNDDLRRGLPTNHKVFGAAVATLAGDALLNEAMNVMFEMCLNSGRNVLKSCSLISKGAGAEGMVGGQVVDILSEGKSISYDELKYMHEKKTGALIKASIVSGAVASGAPDSDIKLLCDYGSKLGMTFQIKDDILDVTSSTETLGKPAKSDVENNKTNFVSVFGIDKCSDMCSKLSSECMKDLNDLSGNAEHMKQITEMLLKRDH